MQEKTHNTEQDKPAERLPVLDTGEFSYLMDSAKFAQIQRIGNMFSQSDLVPDVFKGNAANCMVALQMAFRLQVDPMLLMQSIYIVKGKPGLEGKLVIALMNTRGPFTGPVQFSFEGEGDARQCTAYATHRKTGERCSATVTWAMVKAEGWLDKPGSKWKTLEALMFKYRSAAFLARTTCPEVILGMHTTDELLDAEHEITGERVDERPKIRQPRAKQLPVDNFVDHVDEHAWKQETIDEKTGEIKPHVTIDVVTGHLNTPSYEEVMNSGNAVVVGDERVPAAPMNTEPPKKELTDAELKPITKGLCSVIRTKMEGNGLTIDDFQARFGKGIEALNMSEADDAIDWINGQNDSKARGK